MVSGWARHDHLTLIPNPSYAAHLGWPRPSLSRVTVLMGTNPEADYAGFKSNTLDWSLVPDIDLNQALNDPELAKQSRPYSELTTFWVQLNNARPPLDDLLVREALSKAIDRAALVRELATGTGLPTTSIVPPVMPGFQETLGQELGFDADGAQALLAQAGAANPDLAFTFPDSPSDFRRAQFLQAQWKANLGIEVALKPLDAAAYAQAIDRKDYDLTFGGWAADYPDPQDWFGPLFACNAPYNKINFCDPTFDQLVARADTGIAGDRLTLYSQAQSLLLQEVPVVPLFARGRVALVKPWVQGLTLSPLDAYPGSQFLDKVQISPH
jgi:ABC-type oligopeptide transport system substrate-binding subunit